MKKVTLKRLSVENYKKFEANEPKSKPTSLESTIDMKCFTNTIPKP